MWSFRLREMIIFEFIFIFPLCYIKHGLMSIKISKHIELNTRSVLWRRLYLNQTRTKAHKLRIKVIRILFTLMLNKYFLIVFGDLLWHMSFSRLRCFTRFRFKNWNKLQDVVFKPILGSQVPATALRSSPCNVIDPWNVK